MLCEVSRIWRMPLPRYEKAESRCRLIEIQMHAIRACEHESLEKVGRQVAFDALVSGCSARSPEANGRGMTRAREEEREDGVERTGRESVCLKRRENSWMEEGV